MDCRIRSDADEMLASCKPTLEASHRKVHSFPNLSAADFPHFLSVLTLTWSCRYNLLWLMLIIMVSKSTSKPWFLTFISECVCRNISVDPDTCHISSQLSLGSLLCAQECLTTGPFPLPVSSPCDTHCYCVMDWHYTIRSF